MGDPGADGRDGDPGADGRDGDPGPPGKHACPQSPLDKTINSMNDYILPREPAGRSTAR